jgi:peptidoglycan-N-acetylglucosamine deacetylase
MLNFRNTTIFFCVLLALTAVMNIFLHIPVAVYILLLLAYSLILFYGSYFIQAGFYIKITCAAKTSRKEIAISFDDGPAIAYTPEILQVLKDNQIQAVFFCIGNRIAGNEKILQQVHAEGHIIGNHSYSHHFWFDLFSSKKMLADLQLMDETMKEVTGLSPRLFRPPYGVTNPNLGKAITRGNYIPVGWSVRSMDTVITDEDKLLKKITRSLHPGAIILFHDTSKATLGILPAFIKQAAADGYEIVRLDKMLKLNPYV